MILNADTNVNTISQFNIDGSDDILMIPLVMGVPFFTTIPDRDLVKKVGLSGDKQGTFKSD